MIFVDTNYFLRFLFDDGSPQHEKASSLFLEAARGEKDLITSTLVIFEIFWVLESYYKLKKIQKINIIQNILDMVFVQLEERSILQNSLERYRKSSLELEDCYNISFSIKNDIKDFATFDKKVKKFL